MSSYRAVMTTTDRERISGEADVADDKVYQSVSRIRNRIDELEKDMELLDEHHPDLAQEVRNVACSAAYTDRQRLEEEARERWGEKWAIEQRHWADGTTSMNAYHVEPTEDPGVAIREHLFVEEDGEVFHERIRVRQEETLEVLEHDEQPEEATSDSDFEE